MIDIHVKVSHLTKTRTVYAAYMNGELLLKHWDPETNVARLLTERGHTGPISFTMDGASGSTTYPDVQHLAKRMAVCTEKRGPAMTKYVPFNVSWVDQERRS